MARSTIATFSTERRPSRCNPASRGSTGSSFSPNMEVRGPAAAAARTREAASPWDSCSTRTRNWLMSRAAVLLREMAGLRVSDQAVIHQRQLVANGFEALPHRHLLLSFEPLKGAGFDGCDQVGESFIEGVEGRIHSGVGGVPEFHASIVFELSVR